MNKIQIASAIKLTTGKQIAQVAKDYGYSKHSFYRAINGEPYTAKTQAIIADIIGKPVDEIWPNQQEQQEQQNA